ncbi:hypothetical protein [Haliangium sp.]|uniref:hypothetical protein n=1 Tax=Haliangium sp. TaxID=2663208 RepID=UPI003D0FB371
MFFKLIEHTVCPNLTVHETISVGVNQPVAGFDVVGDAVAIGVEVSMVGLAVAVLIVVSTCSLARTEIGLIARARLSSPIAAIIDVEIVGHAIVIAVAIGIEVTGILLSIGDPVVVLIVIHVRWVDVVEIIEGANELTYRWRLKREGSLVLP